MNYTIYDRKKKIKNAKPTFKVSELKDKTFCIFHTPTYLEVAGVCEEYDNLYSKDEYIIDIIDGRTGEVLANRDNYGLWEINA